MAVQSECICVNAIVYLSMNKSLIHQQAWGRGANSWQKSLMVSVYMYVLNLGVYFNS